jgi:hypothetical protein
VKSKKQRISAAAAKRIGGKLGVDWSKVDLEQFRRGLEVEPWKPSAAWTISILP